MSLRFWTLNQILPVHPFHHKIQQETQDCGDVTLIATCRKNSATRRKKEKQGNQEPSSSISSSSFPHPNFEKHIMTEDQPPRITLEDYSSTFTPQYFTSIAQLEVQAANITYPHSLIQLIQGNLFHGLPNEDPYAHLATYIEICNMVKIAGVLEDVICLNLFSFSLECEAKIWCHSFKVNS